MTRRVRSLVISFVILAVLGIPKTAAADWNTICGEWLRTHDWTWVGRVWESYDPDGLHAYLDYWSRAYEWIYGEEENFPDQYEWFAEQFTITFTNACGG